MEMTAIIMGDVNTVYTLECAHRRQLLAARARLTISPLPCTKTIGGVYIDDFVILSVLLFSDVHVASSPIEVQRADAMHDFLQMPTNASKSGIRGRVLERSPRRRCRHFRIPSRTASLAHAHHDSCHFSRNKTLLQRLLGGWAFALAFRREAFACLDVACTAAATFPSSRRCRLDGTSFSLSQDSLLCWRRT